MSVPKKKEPPELPFRYGSSVAVGSSSTSSDFIENESLCQSAHESCLSELTSKFVPRKYASSILYDSFLRIRANNLDEKRIFTVSRSDRLAGCASHVSYNVGKLEDGTLDYDNKRLRSIFFCKDRLCPMCNWRRSLKIYSQVSQIIEKIFDDYRFIFLTLTVPSCSGDMLSSYLDDMTKAFYRLKCFKRFKGSVKGFHRVLEITVNQFNGTYHPHIHLILAVPKNYFESDLYIPHHEWLSMWRKAMKCKDIKFVNVKAIKPKKQDENYLDALKKAVLETSKYSVKGSDFLGIYHDGKLIKPFPNKIIDKRVLELGSALYHRQLSVFGGIFFETQKILKLDDAENGDLVLTGEEKFHPYVAEMILVYHWNAGLSSYQNCDIFESNLEG